MESMGVTRDDLFESLEETACESITIPTKVKTAFTRERNKTHGSDSDITKVRTKGKKGKTDVNLEEKKENQEDEQEDELIEEDLVEDEWDVDDTL